MEKQSDPNGESVTYIAINSDLVTALQHTLEQVNKQLALCLVREESFRKEVERSRLLTEADAQVYLSRDTDTLRYYRSLGLISYKKGKDRWYNKGEIDDWLATGRVNRHSPKK